MEGKETQRVFSTKLTRRGDRETSYQQIKDVEGVSGFSVKFPQDYPLRILWKKGFVRLVLVAGVLWMLLIMVVLLLHVWSCQSSLAFFSAICNRDGRVFIMLDTMGFVPKPPHRCSIPLANNVDKVAIPKDTTPDVILENLSYIEEDVDQNNGTESTTPIFGGHQSWAQRDQSFKLEKTMKVHCGFIRGGGAEMSLEDIEYVKKCKFVVASGIFDGYDVPHQPTNISQWSRELFCFLMVVDKASLNFIKSNVTVTKDENGGKWVGIWRLIPLKNPPYDEPRRNGKVPKILTHRLFPQTQYSIWIDGKMELIVDPLLMLERYLWRGKHSFAVAQHKHHHSIFEEADAIKRRKRYARPLIDLHMKIYRYEGMQPWSILKNTASVMGTLPCFGNKTLRLRIGNHFMYADVPEGAIIIREHTPLNNLFSCLWFNEVNLFTPRDQLSFGYVVYRLGGAFKFHMFPNCEYYSLFNLHPHTREHSSKIEWVKDLKELNKGNSNLKETRGGLGLWTPYPGDLSSVVLPPVARTSKAG